MTLVRTDENELLTALHGGMIGDRPWGLFLHRLRARIGADICCLWVRKDVAEWRCVDVVKSHRYMNSDDILLPNSFEMMRPNRVYRPEELGHDQWSAEKISDARHMMIPHDHECDTVLSVYMSGAKFGSSDAALLTNLAPHLCIALRVYSELSMQRLKAMQSDRALAEMATGWVLLDGQGRVLETTALAQEMIEERRMLHIGSDRRLHCVASGAQAMLQQAIANPEKLPRAAWLSLKPLVQMVVAKPVQDADIATVLMLVRKVREPMMNGGRYLSDLFGLTRSEALLAARIAEGEAIAQAANALSLTSETARNYSKRIYAKTGTRGQADLARVLLGGVSMLGW